MSTAPSPFSTSIPNLQLVWDSTSLKALQMCPTFYKYRIIDGWAGSGVDLEFGGYFASAVERFKKARLDGKSREDAMLEALQYVTEASWIDGGDSGHCDCPDGCNGCEYPQGRPWGGTYEQQWRCTGVTKFKNAKGNHAKCPWSHKGKWFPSPAPDTCGQCGSPTETAVHYAPGDNAKNRHTLVRLLVWYCDEQPEDLRDGLAPYKFPNGQPAVELSFKVPLPWKAPSGEPYVLAGHLDSIMSFGEEHFIADNKTTKKTINAKFWQGYTPDTQIDTYDLMGTLLFPELKLKGVMIEAAQTMVEGARFGHHIFYKTEEHREEHLRELEWWLRQAERFAETGYYPMNKAACWTCQFNSICSKAPSQREMYLKGSFVKRHWNPLEER